MAIVGTNIIHNNTTGGSGSATTASVTLAAGKFYLLTVHAGAYVATQGPPSSITGNGTWALVNNTNFDTGNFKNLAVLSAVGTGTTGTITINLPATCTQIEWSVDEFTGTQLAGTSGAAAIAQSGVNTGTAVTSLTVTLGAFASVSNATFGAFLGNNGGTALTVGTGFTGLGSDVIATSRALLTEYKATNDTTVDMTTPSCNCAGVAIELSALLTVPTAYFPFMARRIRVG